jgi:multiple sugar transport system permease protein
MNRTSEDKNKRGSIFSGMRFLKYKKYTAGYLFLLPFFVLFAMFIIIPVIWGFFISFNSYNIINPMKWIGLSNYINLFTNDDMFIKALQNTLYFAVIAGPIGFISSFFFAWVINQLKLRNAFSLAFYAPSITSVLAISVVWLSMFSSTRVGIINNFLINLGLITDPIGWTIDPKYIMPLIIFISVWMGLGTGFLTNLAGFATMNPDIYEAGKIDGIKNRFQELFLLTIPQMKPQLLFNAILSIVASLNVYDLTVQIAGFPSPDNCALTLVSYMYDRGFVRFELGYASAISFVLLLISFVLGQIVMKAFSEKD